MTVQILVPLHTYPDGNSVNIAAHVGAIARHLGPTFMGWFSTPRFRQRRH